eukprot:gene30231-39439_t
MRRIVVNNEIIRDNAEWEMINEKAVPTKVVKGADRDIGNSSDDSGSSDIIEDRRKRFIGRSKKAAWSGVFVTEDDDSHAETMNPVVGEVRNKKGSANNSHSFINVSNNTKESLLELKRKGMSIPRKFFYYIHSYFKCICLSLVVNGSISLEKSIFVISAIQCFITETLIAGKGINTVMVLLLAAAINFNQFPANFVRPQVSIALITLSSIAIEIVNCMLFGYTPSQLTGIIFISIFKLALLISLLYNTTPSSRRARKYLIRRFRLFGLSWQQPQRIMRDVRARLLAIGWIHVIASVYYVICAVLSITVFDYSIYYLSHNLPAFLFTKGLLSFFIFLGVWYDTDIVLCLWYFGCLSFNLNYVRKYISKKRIELGGWPLAFSFYHLRFSILKWLKVFDFVIGLYGWAILAPIFTPDFFTRERKLRIFLMFVTLVQLVTDVWCPLLFYMVQWLLRRRKLMKILQLEDVSDDSEIDEFQLKADLAVARRALEKSKRVITVGMNPNATKSSESRVVSKPAPAKSLLKPSSSQKGQRKVHPDYLSMYDPFERYTRDNGRGNQYFRDEMAEDEEEEVEDEKEDDLINEIISPEEYDNEITSGPNAPIRKSWIA